MKQLMQNQVVANARDNMAPAMPPQTPQGSLTHPADQGRGESTDKAGYVGSTHWSAILDDIQELKVTLGGLGDSADNAEDVDISPPEASPVSRRGGELIFGSSQNYSLTQIISKDLPSKLEVDRMLASYFQGETHIVPFIHAPHFQRQYRDFWGDPSHTHPLWLSLLFSICCLASIIRTATLLNEAPSAVDRDTGAMSSKLHIAAGKCLVLGEYHRPQQFSVEALALYAHCKNLGSLDPSREAGTILGLVVRMAYEMGYHRDPDSLGTFTVFEGEMRRRVWASCKQMDLMSSFQLGLPSNIYLENCDTKSPRNLSDSDFDEATTVLPASRSETEPTKILWFIVKERQMPSFAKVCQDALSFKEKSEAEIMLLDEEIRQMHTTIPEVLRTRAVSESIADPPFLIITRLYVEFIFLKSLCVLHRRYMARGHAFSTQSCVEAGKRIVGLFIDVYKEFALGGQLSTERWMLNNFTMNDFLLGTMVLCLFVHTQRKKGGQRPQSVINSTTEKEVLSLLEQAHLVCVQKSDASRDALRVSHAVRLILDGVNPSSIPNANVLMSSPSGATGFSPHQMQSTKAGNALPAVDMTPLSLSPQPDHNDDGTAFGLLDPFNFMGNEFENMDWTMFDPQLLGQDTSSTAIRNFSFG